MNMEKTCLKVYKTVEDRVKKLRVFKSINQDKT